MDEHFFYFGFIELGEVVHAHRAIVNVKQDVNLELRNSH